jgi:hypothetical protein
MADPPRAAHRTHRLAGIQVGVMSPLEPAHVVVVAPEHVGRPGQQLEVLRGQRRRPIGGRQRRVGVCPRMPGVELAAALDQRDVVHNGPIIVARHVASRPLIFRQ